ncbi:MAG: HD domain-containing protein [Elusimicrobia bacterium]|nr:HD domain-containing protein [Elusimicrobiota bacterium]
MKFSDILKKKKDAVPSPADAAQAAAGPAAVKPPESFPDVGTALPEEPDEIVEKRVQDHALKAVEVYTEAVAGARSIYNTVQNTSKIETTALPKDTVGKIIATLQSGNQELLALADRSAPDNYLFGHVVNVAIFSIRLGLSLKLSQDEIMTLAYGALFHDLGMMACLPIALKPSALSPAELAQIRKHPTDGQTLLARFSDLSGSMREDVAQIVGQIHERVDGSGYPEHRPGAGIHKLAKIVGVCDVYEAITHVRAWRPRSLPHQALRLMIEQHEKSFEPGSVKTLIESLSLYPAGSFVRLSSGEISRVIFTNPGLPTRPKVKVLIDGQGRRVPVPRIINLGTQPILYIADAVDETKIHTDDQRLLLELRAQRWWVKGL